MKSGKISIPKSEKVKQINEKAFTYYGRLKKIRDFVNENYAEEIPLQKAAQIAAMERTYFSTFFRQKVGITFSEWLRLLRVSRAIEMISTSNYSISHVAFAVGFGDLRTFERAFKQYTGKTPSEFKRSQRP